MVVSEGAINNIMGGMENTAGVRLHSHRHKLKQRFDIIRKLGQGTYGKVQLAVNKETGQEVAIKTIKKAKIETEQDLIRIRREIQIMSSVQHPQIIHIYEVFENREKMVLVMEYAAGGELYDYLSERKVLSEDEARRVFRHVASATYYCHKHKICHRDLKLENILLDLDGNAKIADFGLSNVFDDKHRLDTFCGSPLYASPEIVKGIPYVGPEVDCWSLGVLLYTLVYGAMPFDGSNFKRLVKQITQGDYYEPKKPSRASDLIRHMLTVSASKRATVEEICSHWWVNEGFSEPCLEVAEALANQTPVRLDLLLSLAPKHINSEHMLIQPEEDDNSARSPPNSEAARPPPNLKLPPPPSADTPAQITPARSASLGALGSVSTNEIEALVAQKMQKRREEEEEEEEDERKRKAADETGMTECRKKKRDSSDASIKGGRKEQKRNEETGGVGRRPPACPENESAEHKKTLRRKDTAEIEEQERTEQRKSGEKKKRESLLVDGEGNDTSSERRRSMKKAEKVDGEKVERKKSVKKRESGIERDASEGGDRTERKKSAKKRDSVVTSDSCAEKKKTSRKKDAFGDDLIGREDGESAYVPVINGEGRDVGEEGGERGKSGIGLGGTSKVTARLDQSPSPQESRELAEGKIKSEGLQESPMEVEEVVKKSPSRSRSGESERATKGTSKASGSLVARESVSPVKQPGAPVLPSTPTTTTTTTTTTTSTATTTTTAGAAAAAASPQESPRKKPSPPPSQPPKVSDARKAFEAKPVEKPTLALRKKSTAEPSTSPTTAKDTTAVLTKESAAGKSPAREKSSPAKEMSKETEKHREKSPRVGKETPNRSKTKVEAEVEKKKVEEPIKKDKTEVSKKVSPVAAAATEKSNKVDERIVTPRPPEANRKDSIAKQKESKVEASVNKADKPSKPEAKQTVCHQESSESSDSESEAERLLKVLSEKREKVEAAKQEKLRKVSGSNKESTADMVAISEEPQLKSPTKSSPRKSPAKISPSKSPEKALPPPDAKEIAPEQKFATLPRGFKTKGSAHAATPASLPPPSDRPKKDRGAINQEIEGMMSAIKAVDQAITKEPSEGTQKTLDMSDTDRKKTKLEIVLNNKQASQQQPEVGGKRASYAEIKLSSPSTKEPLKTPGFRSEVCATVGAVPAEPATGPQPGSMPGPRPGPGSGPGPGEAQLQRAKRERIIPIMLEDDDDDDDDDTTASESHIPLDSHRRPGSSMSCGSAHVTPLITQLPNSRFPEPRTPPVCTPAPEPIRKSRRERIIPIAVEGEGLVTPPPHVEEGPGLGAARAHQAFSRTLSGRPNNLSRGRGFLLDHSESFSSAGEEEEEDEDDGFQILTAESLFSTLLNRVRSLTRKMNAEDGRGDRVRRTSNRPTPEPSTAGIPGTVHSGSAGFWSSLYNSPRDSPARRISDTMSRNSLGRDEDGLGGLGSPLWTRSVSRDPSDADTLFSEGSSSAQFGTLPRGWRASRWSGAEDGGESDTSEASVRSMGRRPQYSRAPSRELHNIPDESAAAADRQRGYSSGGMSLPRPYSTSSGNNLQQGRQMHDSADRIAAMYGTLRGPMRRPHSTVGGTPGEYLGRDGGHCEQRLHNNAATHNGAYASQYSPSNSKCAGNNTESLKRSVQEQLQQLVRELEEGDDSSDWRSRDKNGANRQLYASNPALHLNCPTSLSRDQKSVSNADISKMANGSSSSVCHIPNETTANSRNSKTIMASSMAPRDSINHKAQPQTRGASATGILSRERTGSLRGLPSQHGEWNRVGGNKVRSRDSSTLEALRRSSGQGGMDLHTYQRGRSEDLRHTLDSLAKLDTHKPRRVSSLAGGTSKDIYESQGLAENCVTDHLNNINTGLSSRTEPLHPPATTTTSDKNNNSNSHGTTVSNSGIPIKTNTGSVPKGEHTSQTGPTNTTLTNSCQQTAIPNNNSNKDNVNSNIPRSGSDFPQTTKVYRKSMSRELTPTIETAKEKISQLNSGTLKRISPFEAYRRTKSRELPLENTNVNNNKEKLPATRLKHPQQVSQEHSISTLEKTKTSAVKRTDITKPSVGEHEAAGQGGPDSAPSSQVSASLNRSSSAAKSEQLKNGPMSAAKTGSPIEKNKEKTLDKAQSREQEAEKSEDKAKVKKTPSGESLKPKSMYKMLTSRFNRSASFVSDNSRSAAEDEEGAEKEDKFRLKRPSRFLKSRTEKSSSKTSVCDTDDDADKLDKKPSKKLTDALNKFLGRKDSTKEETRPMGQTSNKIALPNKSPTDENHPKKPPRAKEKKGDERFANEAERHESKRAQSVVPEVESTNDSSTTISTTQPNYTLESATKSICNHLSQLENDITSRIGNMGTQEQHGGGVRSAGGGGGRVAAGPNISNYGLSPALANRRNGRPTNLDAAMDNLEGSQHTTRAPSAPPPSHTSATKHTTNESDKKKAQSTQVAGSSSPTPAECTEEQRAQSEAEDESVMDRITRKSYYSKFQEKKRPKLWRANTREDMDQQLAAAKARLLKEEREEASLGARRLSSSRSPPLWDHDRPASRTSLPPEDATILRQQGGWRSSSLQPDHLLGPLLPSMSGDPALYPRPPSLPPNDRFFYSQAPSMPRNEYLSHGTRVQSNPPEDLLTNQYSRRSSVTPDDFSVRPTGGACVYDTMAAGSFASQVAADDMLQQGEIRNHESSEGHMQSSEPTSMEESRSQAREELSRRLTHLTRLSGNSGLGGWSHNAPQREGEQRSYRRTNTTGRLTGETTGPHVYRRTNTMDLPPADARARPGSEYRRHLQQDPKHRYSAARTLVEGEPLTNPNPSPHSRPTSQTQHLNSTRPSHPTPYIAPHNMHSSSSASSSSSHITSPSSSSSSYRGSGLYSPSPSIRYNPPMGRKTSFYRY